MNMDMGLRVTVVASLLSAVALGGCAVDTGEEGVGGAGNVAQGGENVDTTQEALDPAWATGPYNWSQGQSSIQLKPISTHHCVLTKIGGDFDGGGELAYLYQSGDYWRLGGTSAQSGVKASAYCFATSKFLANGSARWSSETISVSSSGTSNSTDAWWGDAATMLSGFSGKMLGSQRYVYIAQSTGAFTPSKVHVHTDGTYLKAFAHSFFAGEPESGKRVLVTGEYSINSNEGTSCSLGGSGDNEVAMQPVDDYMCYFTSIGGGGDWDGGQEYVEIYPKVVSGGIERWHLRAHSGYCDHTRETRAKARCMKRDQRGSSL